MNKNILLVEYDETSIITIKELISFPEIEITVVSDGDSALRLMAKKPFDLVITAAMLPRFHGFKLCQDVVSGYPNVPVIIISAIYKGLQYRHMAVTQYRAADFFEKPMEREKFKQRVLELLNFSPTVAPEKEKPMPLSEAKHRAASPETVKFSSFEDKPSGASYSSEDIFGDILQKVEQSPKVEIQLDESPPPPSKPAPVVQQKSVPTPQKPPAPAKEIFREKPVAQEPYARHEVARHEVTAKPQPFTRGPESAPQKAPTPSVPRAEPPPKDDLLVLQYEETVPSMPAMVPPLITSPKVQLQPAASAPPRAVPVREVQEVKIVVPPPPPPKPRVVTRIIDPANAQISALENKVKTQKIAIPQVLRERKSDTIPLNIEQLMRKRESPSSESRLKKIEDDIMRKLDETLSGLGFPGSPKAPAKKPAEKEKPFAEPKPKSELPEPKKESQFPEPKKESQFPEQKREAEFPAPRSESGFPTTRPVEDEWDYDILGLIARGGMAEIYKAKKRGHKGFEKIIAIKKILSGYGEDDKYIEMLIDEAKVAAQLSHPNIVHIYDLKKKDSYYFIVMEYVLGKDLRVIQRVLQEHNRLVPEDLSIFVIIKVLEALNYAHKASDSEGKRLEIVHRDVSPPNILISYNGDVKLTDFGISKASIKIHQTVSGALKGKLLYMSPEQAMGEENIDYRSDLYSAGLILFELLTGKKLFMDRTEMGILKKVQQGQVISPREHNHSLDPVLESVVMKSLQKDKDKRYQSAAEMITDLQAYLHKKYNYVPGPIHLAQFITDLFQDDIRKEGIKIDQLPTPARPVAKKVEEPKPEPAAPPPPKVEIKLEPKAEPRYEPPKPLMPSRPAPTLPPPPLEEKTAPERKIVEINLDDDLGTEDLGTDQDIIISFTSTSITLPGTLDKTDDEKKPEPPKKGWK